MQQIQLSDQLYIQAQQRASDAGFASVDDYVAEIVKSEISGTSDNYDHFFTPQLIAQLNETRSAAQAGAKTFTQDEIEQHFSQKAQEWARRMYSGNEVR